MTVDSPTSTSRANSEIDICTTRSGFLSTNSAIIRSDGLKLSIALLMRIKQPAFDGARCLARAIRSSSKKVAQPAEVALGLARGEWRKHRNLGPLALPSRPDFHGFRASLASRPQPQRLLR